MAFDAKEAQRKVEEVSKKETQERKKPEKFTFGMPVRRLDVDPLPGFYMRWINDMPGRVQLALNDGYDFVDKKEVDFYEDITSMNAGEGNQVRKLVGTHADGATPLFAYLMKIPSEWKREKEEIIQSRIDALENSINSGEHNDFSKSYVPKEGISLGRKKG